MGPASVVTVRSIFGSSATSRQISWMSFVVLVELRIGLEAQPANRCPSVELPAQGPGPFRGAGRAVVVVEEPDVRRDHHVQPSGVGVDGDVGRELVGLQLTDLPLEEGSSPSELVPFADLHRGGA